jgi:hypothetical protein
MMEVELRAGWDILEKKKVSCHCRELKDESSFIQSVAWSLHNNACITYLNLIYFAVGSEEEMNNSITCYIT